MQRRTRRADHRLELDDERFLAFWRERHLCTLTTLRADGTPHVVPVGATLDAATGVVRVIARRCPASTTSASGRFAI